MSTATAGISSSNGAPAGILPEASSAAESGEVEPALGTPETDPLALAEADRLAVEQAERQAYIDTVMATFGDRYSVDKAVARQLAESLSEPQQDIVAMAEAYVGKTFSDDDSLMSALRPAPPPGSSAAAAAGASPSKVAHAQRAYLEACRDLSLVPSRKVCDQLDGSTDTLDLAHFGISDVGLGWAACLCNSRSSLLRVAYHTQSLPLANLPTRLPPPRPVWELCTGRSAQA